MRISFCRPEQVKDEFPSCDGYHIYRVPFYGFQNFEAQISLRDKVNREKYIGSDDNWEKAEQAIIEACAEKGLPAKIEYGEAAFYGPKLDFMVKDAIYCSLQRYDPGWLQLAGTFWTWIYGFWQSEASPGAIITVLRSDQWNVLLPYWLNILPVNSPLWLTPEQVVILPISEKFNEYAEQVKMYLKIHEIRAIVDDRNEKIGRKIRDNEMKRIPYMLIVGEKEAEKWRSFCS